MPVQVSTLANMLLMLGNPSWSERAVKGALTPVRPEYKDTMAVRHLLLTS